MTLADSPSNTELKIADIQGDPVVVSRLREIGFIRGETVFVHGRAPLGGPFIVELRGARVALRKEEASCVKV